MDGLSTTALTLIVLTLFRVAESKVPIGLIVHAEVRFARDAVIAEDALRALVSRFGFSTKSSPMRSMSISCSRIGWS